MRKSRVPGLSVSPPTTGRPSSSSSTIEAMSLRPPSEEVSTPLQGGVAQPKLVSGIPFGRNFATARSRSVVAVASRSTRPAAKIEPSLATAIELSRSVPTAESATVRHPAHGGVAHPKFVSSTPFEVNRATMLSAAFVVFCTPTA